MAGITVGGASGVTLNYTSADALAVVNRLAMGIATSLSNGTSTSFNYTGSSNVAPEPPSGTGGVVNFTQPTSMPVFVNGADQAILVGANGPVSVQGGAPGVTFIAGSGLAGAPLNVAYTNITPSGNLTDQIAILGGNNLISTATFGTGNYNVATGSGNDSINILLGNSTVNAGTGNNTINVGVGSNVIFSEGYDSITGAINGGGFDTVNIGSGQTTINPAGSHFIVNDESPNSLFVTLGSQAATLNVSGSGSAFLNGPNSSATVFGSGAVVAHPTSTGDTYSVSGAASANIVAGAENEVIDGRSSSGNEVFRAGTGNDTLIAGSGAVILSGAVGASATALLVSGANDPTTFAFVNGQFSGGADTIAGFKSSDVLSFTGYGSSPQPSATVSGGVTTIKLADQTTITITGATPTSGQYRIS